MAASVTPISASPLAARLAYLADLQKAGDAYDEAWWARPRPIHLASARQTPLRGSFSSDEMPNLDNSSELPSPSSSAPSTPAEYVQEYFEQVQKHRERYNSAWRTAVEKRTLCVRDPHNPAIELDDKARTSNLLAAQLDAFAQRDEVRKNYYQAWSDPLGGTILVHKPHDPAIKLASKSTNSDSLAIQLESNVKQHAEDEAYDEAWINAAKEGLLATRKSTYSGVAITQASNTNALEAQLQAASDEEVSERAYADAWVRYGEITRYARTIDAWKSHHLELLRKETEYHNAWFDEATKPKNTKTIRSKLAKFGTRPFASQIAMFQDIHARDEQYNEAWTSYGQICEAPVRTPRRRARPSLSRSPRPAFTRRLPGDITSPEISILGLSAIDLVRENDEPIKILVDRMKTTTITPASSLLLSPPSRKRISPSSPRPKKRSDKTHFMWPECITDEEKVGLTARGNLQPYLSSLIGKIVSFEFVGQSELSISPDQASPSTPMQLVRRANLKCQSHTVCKVKASISITSPPTAHKYAQDPLPLFDVLRQLGHAAVIELDQVGESPLDPETGRQAIWRKYSVVSGAFRCQVKETFIDRRMFTKDGCDFGKKAAIKDGLVISPDGVDYLALPL